MVPPPCARPQEIAAPRPRADNKPPDASGAGVRPAWAGGSGPLGASSASSASPSLPTTPCRGWRDRTRLGITRRGTVWRTGARAPDGLARPRPGPHERRRGNGHENEGPFVPTRGAERGTPAGARLGMMGGGSLYLSWMGMWLDAAASGDGGALGRCGLLLAGRHACDGGSLGAGHISIGIMVWLPFINHRPEMDGSVVIR